ncbi:hypothetical protein STEG23_001616 [Scotinomys teguina]
MTVTPLGQDQDCSLKNREPDVPASWFLDPGGWSKTAAVRLYFIFPGICTLSLHRAGKPSLKGVKPVVALSKQSLPKKRELLQAIGKTERQKYIFEDFDHHLYHYSCPGDNTEHAVNVPQCSRFPG